MTESSRDAHGAIEALAIKRQSPRFEVTLAVRLRTLPEGGGREARSPAEEVTVTENVGLGGALVPSMLPVVKDQVVEFGEVEGPFQTRARILGILEGGDGLTHLNLRFLGGDEEAARDLLRRAGAFSITGQIAVEAQAFADTHDLEAIEGAVREAFQDVPGSWRVELSRTEAFSPPWWVLVVEGRHEMFRMSFRPSEQNAQFIHDQLRDALRRRGLVD